MKTLPHSQRPTRRRSGFSLVETLMATGIVSSTALGALALLASAMSMGLDGQARSKAMVIAQDLFHDMQSSSPMLTPSVLDERQTKRVWPLAPATYAVPRHVILFDGAARPLPTAEQPQAANMASVYDEGAKTLNASWLAMIEGVEQVEFTVDPSAATTPLSGAVVGDPQVTAAVNMTDFTALGNVAYDYPAVVTTAPAATSPAPKTALTKVTISVESPPEASAKVRKKYRYCFYWNR